jgi:carbonic anhydrase/acetyltransferase-like protein (isoleucine patch superfamily)
VEPCIIAYRGKRPVIAAGVFVAPTAVLAGDVEVATGASIWFNCVLRGDVNFIRIGAQSNVQDGTVIHCRTGGWPTLVGANVTIGHNVVLHACTLQDGAFVGMQAVVMDNCIIEEDAMLAAGALLSPGKHIKRRELWAGRPAKFMRAVSDEEILNFQQTIKTYCQLGADYLAGS